MPSLAALIRRTLHILLPVGCVICKTPLTDDPVPFFCRRCWTDVTPLSGPACPRCGRPFPSPVALRDSPSFLCGACRIRPPAYTKAWASFAYEPPLQQAIQLLKYQGKVALAASLGDLMAQSCPRELSVDLLMPVPLHPDRLREREFNQALLLADRLNRRLRLPLVHDNLIRLRRTPPQTTLRRSARRKNLRRSFTVLRPESIEDRRILLVDDVMTTGTTVNECAKALRKAGAGDVYVYTLARTL